MPALRASAISRRRRSSTGSIIWLSSRLGLPTRAAYQPMIQATNRPSEASRQTSISATEVVFNAIPTPPRPAAGIANACCASPPDNGRSLLFPPPRRRTAPAIRFTATFTAAATPAGPAPRAGGAPERPARDRRARAAPGCIRPGSAGPVRRRSPRSRNITEISKFRRKLRWSKLALPMIARSSSHSSALLCSMRGPYSWIFTPALSSSSK